MWDAIPQRLTGAEGSTSYVWIGRRAGDRGASNARSPPEAARVQSFERTEPMRCERWIRVGRGLDSAANAPIERASLCGDRARRFAWPARGTERFLGRSVSTARLTEERRQCRPCVGTRKGLIPYSCLVPPRLLPMSGHRCLNHPGAEPTDIRAREANRTLTITTRKVIPKCHRGRNVAHPSGAR